MEVDYNYHVQYLVQLITIIDKRWIDKQKITDKPLTTVQVYGVPLDCGRSFLM